MMRRFSPWFKQSLFLVILLAVANVVFILLALQTPDVPLTEWRKGPPIHQHSFYGPIIAPSAFWVSALLILDIYALLTGVLHSIPAVRNRKTALPAILCSIASLAISLSITEMVIRRCAQRLDMDLFRPHADLFYWNKVNLRDAPDLEPVTTNRRGFRDTEEVSEHKEPGEYRVFVVGDSSAFGHGVPNHKSFSEQLEPILQERLGRPVRVINAACPGHCTYEGLIIFQTMGIPLKPDLLVVSYNNDPAPEYAEEKHRAPSSPLAASLRRWLYRSDTYLLFQRTVQNAMLSARHGGRHGTQPALMPRVSLADYRANLHEFVKLATEHGCKVLFVKMPINYRFLLQSGDRKKFYNPAYPATLANLCRSSGYDMVNVDRYCLANTMTTVFLKGHHFHPGIEGHHLIAELLADQIAPATGSMIDTAPGSVSGVHPERPVLNIGYSLVTPLHCAIGEILANTAILERHGLEGTFLGFLTGKDQDTASRHDWLNTTFSCEVAAMVHLDKHRRFDIAGSPGTLGDIGLVVTEASGIRKVEALRGGSVIIQPGASAGLMLEKWLSDAGMEYEREITIVQAEGGAEAAVNAISANEVQAAVLWDPWLTRALAGGGLRILQSEPFWSTIFLDRNFTDKEPDKARQCLTAIGEALKWASTNMEQTVSWVSYRSCIAADIVRETLEKNAYMRGTDPEGLTLSGPVRERLFDCERFAKREKIVKADFALAGRLPAESYRDSGPAARDGTDSRNMDQ